MLPAFPYSSPSTGSKRPSRPRSVPSSCRQASWQSSGGAPTSFIYESRQFAPSSSGCAGARSQVDLLGASQNAIHPSAWKGVLGSSPRREPPRDPVRGLPGRTPPGRLRYRLLRLPAPSPLAYSPGCGRPASGMARMGSVRRYHSHSPAAYPRFSTNPNQPASGPKVDVLWMPSSPVSAPKLKST